MCFTLLAGTRLTHLRTCTLLAPYLMVGMFRRFLAGCWRWRRWRRQRVDSLDSIQGRAALRVRATLHFIIIYRRLYMYNVARSLRTRTCRDLHVHVITVDLGILHVDLQFYS